MKINAYFKIFIKKGNKISILVNINLENRVHILNY